MERSRCRDHSISSICGSHYSSHEKQPRQTSTRTCVQRHAPRFSVALKNSLRSVVFCLLCTPFDQHLSQQLVAAQDTNNTVPCPPQASLSLPAFSHLPFSAPIVTHCCDMALHPPFLPVFPLKMHRSETPPCFTPEPPPHHQPPSPLCPPFAPLRRTWPQAGQLPPPRLQSMLNVPNVTQKSSHAQLEGTGQLGRPSQRQAPRRTL